MRRCAVGAVNITGCLIEKHPSPNRTQLPTALRHLRASDHVSVVEQGWRDKFEQASVPKARPKR